MLDRETERLAADFIRRAVIAGYEENEIKKSFLKKGYPIDEIDRLMSRYINKEVSVEHNYANYILFVMGVLFVLLIVFWLLPGERMCEDQNCFIKSANSCKSASLKQLEEGSVFTYEIKDAERQNECVLVKTATDISEFESQYVLELEGMSMECTFFKGTFNTNWINYLTRDIEVCEGALKDGLIFLGRDTY